MNVLILVARYTEDIRWLRWLELKDHAKILIVDKGEGVNLRSHHTFDHTKILLQSANNIGREGHTFYNFIVQNYNNLPDYLVLVQGNPFDHSPHIIDNLNKFLDAPHDTHFQYLSEEFHDVDLDFKGHYNGTTPLPMRNVWEYIFGTRINDPYEWSFGAGAQFIVSKQAILLRPISVYIRIVELLERSCDPIEGYCMERLHPVVFFSPNF